MSQLPATIPSFASNLPAHLRDPLLFGANEAASSGISLGGLDRISIRQNRFRLVDPSGSEEVINELHLDVVIVSANPNVSKRFYPNAYDPKATEAVAPSCFSDNGIGPSARSEDPQSPSCAACPNNAWGSKVTPSGTQIKACADSKIVAVMLNGEDLRDGLVYQLSVPAASMGGFAKFASDMKQRGAPLPALVVRLAFDPQATYPKLTFTAVGYIDEEMGADVRKAMTADETRRIVGLDDKPAQQAALTGPGAAPAPATAPPVQAAPAPAQAPAPAAFAVGGQAAPAPAAAAAPARAPRGRPRRDAAAAAPVNQPATPAVQAPGPDDVTLVTAAQAVTTAPVAANQQLDTLLGGIDFGPAT